MTPFHAMQALVALVGFLNILDVLTTTYAIRAGVAYEDNSIVARAMHFAGATAPGLLLVKLPLALECLMAVVPQAFAAFVPNAVLVWVADTPTLSWALQGALYAAVVANNVRICWRHALDSVDEEKGLDP